MIGSYAVEQEARRKYKQVVNCWPGKPAKWEDASYYDQGVCLCAADHELNSGMPTRANVVDACRPRRKLSGDPA